MTSRRRWALILGGSMLFLAVFMQIPQFLHQRSPLAKGIMIQMNSDEYVYLARVEEALTGRPEQAAEAIVGDPSLRGSQFALIEAAIGTIFRPTHWRAAEVLQFMDSITPPLLLLVLYLFFLACGFTRPQAFGGAIAFTLIELYGLGRPIHQRESFLLVLFALLSLIKTAKGSWLWALPAGFFLGVLVGIYVWGWTSAWAWLGILLLWEVVEAIQQRRRHEKIPSSFWHLLLAGGVGVLCALPFLRELWLLKQDPLYEEVVFRSGIHPSHLPESIPYTILFSLMALGVILMLFKRYGEIRSYRFAAVTVLTASILSSQQIVHGLVFNYVSHYIFFLACGAVSAVLLAIALRRKLLLISAFGACVYLAAIAWDGRWILDRFVVHEGRFAEQHFASLLPILDDLPRTAILSDPGTSMFLAGATKHDVVYSTYLKNVVMSHKEIAERYCITQLPLPPADRHIETIEHLIYPDAVSAFRDDPSVRQKEVAMVEEACARFDANPMDALRTYHMDYVLWDEERQPNWDLSRLSVPLTKEAAGDGWSLWAITYP